MTINAVAPRRWAEELSDAGLTAEAWAARRRARNAAYADVSDRHLDQLRRNYPSLVEATIAAATRALHHEFNLLGSGPYVPEDSTRLPDASGYRPIDWHVDPVSGLRFPPGVALADWNLDQVRPGRADVKLPWELGRCQHWPLLGQAYRLTGDDRFALEVSRQLRDFLDGNPVAVGVNWTCTMDVGIRAANWTIALDLVRGCPGLDASFWRSADEAMFDHGTFIESHLENHYEVTSNHFLSNILGLFFLAAVFDSVPRGQLWDRQCRAWLVQELDVQVQADGSDFESSVPYHRLVTELFLSAARLADYRGTPLPPRIRVRLREMIHFLLSVERPDGLMPQVGDADDGRLHVLSGYGAESPQDARHLFGPAGSLLGRPEWFALGGEWMAWETAWWGFDPPDRPAGKPSREGLRHFPQAGLTVMRDRRDYLLVTNGVVGTVGFGNHKHNDLLGFEYHVEGVPFLVDPGSFVYTSNPEARNLFRSTRSHNTLSVDGEEQNELVPGYLFRLFEKARPQHLEIAEQDGALCYRGRHHGYGRLPQPVVHERSFRFSPKERVLAIADVLSGEGTHRIRWHFHFAPGVEVSASAGALQARAAAIVLTMTLPPGLEPTLTPAWYSPSYGVRVPCVSVDLESDAHLTGRREYHFRLTA